MEKKDTYLYVLLLPHMDEKYNLSYKIKFGFSENFENRMKSGYSAYYGEGGYRVLYVYKGDFTKEIDETAIKQYLKEYSIFGSEWFMCCQEVLGFFNTYDTSDKLKQKISEIPLTKKYQDKFYKVDYILIDYILQFYYSDISDVIDIQNKREDLKNILRIYSERNQYKYLKEEYNFDLNSFKKYKESRLKRSQESGVNQKVEEFNGIKRVNDRIHYMMDYSEKASERDFKEFLELIPGKYKDYYTIVGPEIIKAYGCEEAKIKKAWREKISNSEIQDNVVSEIYGTFTIGNRYTKSDIKDTLNTLYQKLGYQKKAKATDLELYYYMKPILTSDKKHGFELIGKK